LSFLSRTVKSITGNKPGPANPFGVPDLSYLIDPKRYGDVNNPLGATAGYYDDVIKSASGRGSTDTDYMKLLLGDIDTDTANTVGGLKSDFLDRGLGGPGQISDIEANALSGARENALKEKNRTRLDFTRENLDRESAAQGAKASAASSMLAAILGLKSSGDQAYASGTTGLWNAAEARKNAGKQKSFLGRFGDTFGDSFAKTFGSNLAGGGGSGDDSGGGLAYLKLLMGG
jgi:hypothetical protein